MLGKIIEPDPQYQLSAAARPTPLALNVLQPFEQTANVHHHAGTVARQDAMDLGNRPARVGGKNGDLAGHLLPCPGGSRGGVSHH